MPKRIKILYYSNALMASHGGRLHSEAFCKELEQDKRIEKLIKFPISENRQKASDTSITRKLLKKIPLLQILFFYRRNRISFREIDQVIKKSDINVIHIRLDSNFLIIRKIKKQYPNLLVTTEVNASPFDENFSNIFFKSFFRKLERNCLKHSDANFFVSDYLRHKIMDTPEKNRDYVVQNGVDGKFFKISQNVEQKEILSFGYIGTLDFHKRLKVLINAFEYVSSEKQNTRLIIIGDGPMMEDLKRYVWNKKLQDLVLFKGWIKHDNILEYLEKFDIAIHHSAQPYMSPLKLFEYMAASLPVIGPDTPAVREIFDHNDLLFTTGEEKDLASKMLMLSENKSLRIQLAKNCRFKVESNFKWKHNAQKILDVMLNKLDL